MNIYFTALGCRLNQAEIEMLAREAALRGHTVVRDVTTAEWALINTCTVTHVAARKSRQAIRRMARANPDLRVAVIGCYGEMSADEAAALDGVALVIPNASKEQALDLIGLSAPVATRADGEKPGYASTHTRAFVKVQDGCENRCAYCIVTVARGPSRSLAPGNVLAEVKRRRAEGVNEVVLSGVNIGSYGRDRGDTAVLRAEDGWPLAHLCRAILSETDVPRLRLSSIEPWDVTPELLALWDDPRMCRQLHLPLQSGCDATLRRMNRRMGLPAFEALVADVRACVPGVAITTDIIVGFPGETEAEFAESVATLERLAFARLHVFRFSVRPGTAAADVPDQVDPRIIQRRSEELIALGRELALAHHRTLLGSRVVALMEQRNAEGVWGGLTDAYVRVHARSDADLANALVAVDVRTADADCVTGEIAGMA